MYGNWSICASTNGSVLKRKYDYVIVGGGSAGCTLALRLSEDPDVEVLLVEKGSSYRRLVLGAPLFGMKYMQSYLHVYWTPEQRHCNGRKIYVPVAMGMGGGSSVNAMIYVRGERRSWDRWAEQGAAGWDYASVLPYFRKMEDFEGGETEFHGVGGPVGVSGTRFKSRFGRAFIEACVEMGLERNDDFTGESQSGAGFYQYTQSNGERSSTAMGQFRRAAARRNLHVSLSSEVEQLLFEGSRAVGVRCRDAAGTIEFRAGREVILSAGAVGTPRILMLSGVGPADELRALGIAPVLDHPGVGKGLQDHPRCPILFLPRKSESLKVPALVLPLLRWCLRRDGIFTSTTIAAGAFAQFAESSEVADTQFVVKWAGSPPYRKCIDIQPCLVDVESRGEVRLRSGDPGDDPIVDPNYLSTQREIDVLVAAVRFARELASTQALQSFGLVREELPGADLSTDQELAEYVKNHIETCFHLAGTCRMGGDENAVVDPQLRVHGLDGLRVVDASVMPSLVNGNTNGPTIMIAEKAADLIRSPAGEAIV